MGGKAGENTPSPYLGLTGLVYTFLLVCLAISSFVLQVGIKQNDRRKLSKSK
jgi:hypothetical protein